MGVIVIVAAGVALLLAIGVVLVVRRRGRAAATPPRPAEPTTPRPHRPEPAPMTGLEDALNRTTDSSGTTMADRLNAEAAIVDGLRVTDDTGPLLRRALDRFEQSDAGPADDGAEPAESRDRSGIRPPYTAE